MGMDITKTKAQFSYIVSKIKEAHPTLSYIHVIDARVKGFDVLAQNPKGESIDFIREIWSSPEDDENGRRLISAGGYTKNVAIEHADQRGDLIAFGRYFIANVNRFLLLVLELPLILPPFSFSPICPIVSNMTSL
jgi:NADPH2 dehydrogenase